MLNLLLVFIMLVPGVPAPKKDRIDVDLSQFPDELEDEMTEDEAAIIRMQLDLNSMISELRRLDAVTQLQAIQWRNRIDEAARQPIGDFKRIAFQIANEIMTANADFQRRLQAQLIAGDRKRVEAQLRILKGLIAPVRMLLGTGI